MTPRGRAAATIRNTTMTNAKKTEGANRWLARWRRRDDGGNRTAPQTAGVDPIGTLVPGVAVAGLPQGITNPPVHAADVDRRNEEMHAPGQGFLGPAPGTMVLVFVFLAAFIVYFFVNWKVLSFVWKIG